MSTTTMMGKSDQRTRVLVAGSALLVGLLALATPTAHAQHAETAPATKAPAHDAPAPAETHTTPAADHAAPAGAHGAAPAHGAAAEGEHGESLWVTLARVANFAILAGVLYWFGRKPLAAHLASRGAQIRKDLVDAAEMRTTANARLTEIEARLAGLPAELDALRRRGAEELEAERTRIRVTAEAERDRLVEQARREIASQTRNARAQLRAHAATLAVDVAEARLRGTLTPTEQVALVDAYAAQLRNVQ